MLSDILYIEEFVLKITCVTRAHKLVKENTRITMFISCVHFGVFEGHAAAEGFKAHFMLVADDEAHTGQVRLCCLRWRVPFLIYGLVA